MGLVDTIVDDILPYVLTAVFALVAIINIGINIRILRMTKNKLKFTVGAKLFTIQAAISDIIICIFVLIPASIVSSMQEWNLTDPGCTGHGIMITWAYLVLFGLIDVRCLERAIRIKSPNLHEKVFNSKHILPVLFLCIWVVDLTVAILPLSGWVSVSYDYYHSGCVPRFESSSGYLILVSCLGIGLSIFLFVVCQVIISRELDNKRRKRKVHPLNGNGETTTAGKYNDDKMTTGESNVDLMMFKQYQRAFIFSNTTNRIICVVMFVFWLPYFVVAFVTTLADSGTWRGYYSIMAILAVLTFVIRPKISLSRLHTLIKNKDKKTYERRHRTTRKGSGKKSTKMTKDGKVTDVDEPVNYSKRKSIPLVRKRLVDDYYVSDDDYSSDDSRNAPFDDNESGKGKQDKSFLGTTFDDKVSYGDESSVGSDSAYSTKSDTLSVSGAKKAGLIIATTKSTDRKKNGKQEKPKEKIDPKTDKKENKKGKNPKSFEEQSDFYESDYWSDENSDDNKDVKAAAKVPRTKGNNPLLIETNKGSRKTQDDVSNAENDGTNDTRKKEKVKNVTIDNTTRRSVTEAEKVKSDRNNSLKVSGLILAGESTKQDSSKKSHPSEEQNRMETQNKISKEMQHSRNEHRNDNRTDGNKSEQENSPLNKSPRDTFVSSSGLDKAEEQTTSSGDKRKSISLVSDVSNETNGAKSVNKETQRRNNDVGDVNRQNHSEHKRSKSLSENVKREDRKTESDNAIIVTENEEGLIINVTTDSPLLETWADRTAQPINKTNKRLSSSTDPSYSNETVTEQTKRGNTKKLNVNHISKNKATQNQTDSKFGDTDVPHNRSGTLQSNEPYHNSQIDNVNQTYPPHINQLKRTGQDYSANKTETDHPYNKNTNGYNNTDASKAATQAQSNRLKHLNRSQPPPNTVPDPRNLPGGSSAYHGTQEKSNYSDPKEPLSKRNGSKRNVPKTTYHDTDNPTNTVLPSDIAQSNSDDSNYINHTGNIPGNGNQRIDKKTHPTNLQGLDQSNAKDNRARQGMPNKNHSYRKSEENQGRNDSNDSHNNETYGENLRNYEPRNHQTLPRSSLNPPLHEEVKEYRDHPVYYNTPGKYASNNTGKLEGKYKMDDKPRDEHSDSYRKDHTGGGGNTNKSKEITENDNRSQRNNNPDQKLDVMKNTGVYHQQGKPQQKHPINRHTDRKFSDTNGPHNRVEPDVSKHTSKPLVEDEQPNQSSPNQRQINHQNGKTLQSRRNDVDVTSDITRQNWQKAGNRMAAYNALTRQDKFAAIHGVDNEYDRSKSPRKTSIQVEIKDINDDNGWRSKRPDLELM